MRLGTALCGVDSYSSAIANRLHYAATQRRLHSHEFAHVGRLAQLGQMAAVLIHEISQPITSILAHAGSCIELMNRMPGRDLKLQSAIAAIIQQGERASRLISQSRRFARDEPVARKLVAIPDIVKESIELVRVELRRTETECDLTVGDRIPPIMANALQIQQVMVNLLLNAVEAMSETPSRQRKVIVAVRFDGRRHLTVSVKDRGRGLTRKMMSNIQKPFQPKQPSGLGLGLFLSRTLIEAHGGHLTINQNRGRGVTFSVTLPIDARTRPRHGLDRRDYGD